MNLDAWGALLAVIFGAGGAWVISLMTTRASLKREQKKDEVQLLREEVERLQQRVKRSEGKLVEWERKYDELYTRYATLREKSDARVAELNDQIETLKEKLNDQIVERKKDRIGYDAAIREQSKTIENMRMKLESVKKTTDELKPK